MTGNDYRAIRDRLQLTQQALAGLLGVHVRTISKREIGLSPITREAELALMAILEKRREKEIRKNGPEASINDVQVDP